MTVFPDEKRTASPAGDADAGPRRAMAACAGGEMFVLVHETRSGIEGHLVVAAEAAGKEAVNYMARHARGLICLGLDETIVDRLGLPLMPQTNRSRIGVAYTISIEARQGVSTGISAMDRALTIAAAVREGAQAADVASPGHVFPIRVEREEILTRPAAPAVAVELCREAGLRPGAAICEIMNPDGSMAQAGDLAAFAAAHGLPLARVEDVARFLRARRAG